MHALPESRFSLVDQFVAEIDLLFKISAATGAAFAPSLRIWLSAIDLRQEVKAIHQEIVQFLREAGTCEADPQDRMTDRLLAIQGKMRGSIEQHRALLKGMPRWMLAYWLLWMAEKEARRQYRLLGLSRTLILEHDADCSPVLDEAFETPEALRAALERDALA